LLCALALGLAAGVVQAAPDDSRDPSDAPTGFVDKMRDRAADLVLVAMNFLGVPYRRGGSSDDGFDCSGFTRHIFESSLGLVLPRRVDDQASAPGLSSVKRDQLQPGDLVFFNTLRRTFSHVGIYVGEGKFIHSPRSGGQVRLEDMRQSYWSKRFTGARRAETLGSAPAPAAAAVSATAALPAATNPPPARPSAAADAEAARMLY
jgi:cell wall-associated NlpC family hydrolase